MKKSIALPLAFCGLILGGQSLMAASVTGLNDWCFNVNGNSGASNACNGGAGAVLPGVDLSAFDTTLATTGANNLGTAVFTLGAGLGQSVLFYADYDVNYVAFGSFDDVGTVNGVLPANASYSLDDPNSGTLFAAFAGNTLDNTNHVGTHVAPPTPCCDVAWGLGIGGINVLAGGSGTVTFTVSANRPTGGFFLQQTNFDTGNSIFVSESAVVTGPVGGGVPEPSTFGLGLIASGAAFLYALKRKRAGLVG